MNFKAGEPRDARDPDIHLLRGAPAVRSWSKHEKTVAGWSLCGIQQPVHGTERSGSVTCKFCLHLMGKKENPEKKERKES